MKNQFSAGLAILLLGVVACEPVIAIGWKEIAFVFILMAFLFGPPLYRFIRRVEEARRQKDK
ncbi:MAG TPA: hypothetical protein VLT51_07020 [Anaerolineales bacterium]|nr:hypothetical protein [Anaerolineales bacterium]